MLLQANNIKLFKLNADKNNMNKTKHKQIKFYLLNNYRINKTI